MSPGHPCAAGGDAMTALELHPLSALFPALQRSDFEALREDISAHGQRRPIVPLDGQILDGANRYRACLAANIEPKVTIAPRDREIAMLSRQFKRCVKAVGQSHSDKVTLAGHAQPAQCLDHRQRAVSQCALRHLPERHPPPAILADCPVGDVVLDPFNGSCTTGHVALELGRRCIGMELNPDSLGVTRRRKPAVTPGLPLEAAA